MLKGKWPEISMQYLLCILAFLIPFPYICAAVCIGALLILWILGGDHRQTFQNLYKRKILWAWMAFFLLHAISYTYSTNKSQSSFDIQSKLSIFILPVLIGAGIDLNRKIIERIFFFLNLGITVIAICCVVHGIARCLDEGYFYRQFFFYNDLVDGLDASAVYMAWYVLFSIASLMLLPWQCFYQNGWRGLRIILLVAQVTFFILLSARTLLVLFFVFLIPFYLYKTFKHRRLKTWQTISVVSVFLILAIAVFATENPVKKRFGDIFQKNLDLAWKKDYRNTPQAEFSNLTLRLMVWRIGFENMNEHHLWLKGAGNGDVQDLQNQKMASYGIDVYNPNAEKRSEYFNLNLHNMAIESLMMLGIPGLILFLFIIFAPLFLINKVELKNIFIAFHVIAIFFFLQEAALQTQAGIIYYTFFSTIFLNIYYGKADRILGQDAKFVN